MLYSFYTVLAVKNWSNCMDDAYVTSQDGCYRIAGSRVSLDSVVYAFLDGDSPEVIVQSFPTLTLEQVYGAITYYLAHRADIDAHLRMEESDFERRRKAAREENADLYRRMDEARRAKEPVAR
jgi:uncharacterized protein (DUF433 family)